MGKVFSNFSCVCCAFVAESVLSYCVSAEHKTTEKYPGQKGLYRQHGAGMQAGKLRSGQTAAHYLCSGTS